jgi:hypothetical protein
MIILWTTLAVVSAEFVCDAIDAELERCGIDPWGLRVRRLTDNPRPDQIANYDKLDGNARAGLQWSTNFNPSSAHIEVPDRRIPRATDGANWNQRHGPCERRLLAQSGHSSNTRSRCFDVSREGNGAGDYRRAKGCGSRLAQARNGGTATAFSDHAGPIGLLTTILLWVKAYAAYL